MHELSTSAISTSTAISPSAGHGFLLLSMSHIRAVLKCERSWWNQNVIIGMAALGRRKDLTVVQWTTRCSFKSRTFASFQGQLFQLCQASPSSPNVNRGKRAIVEVIKHSYILLRSFLAIQSPASTYMQSKNHMGCFLHHPFYVCKTVLFEEETKVQRIIQRVEQQTSNTENHISFLSFVSSFFFFNKVRLVTV